MRIAIDARTAASGCKTGKGWYTFNLLQSLIKLSPESEFFLYTKAPLLGIGTLPNGKIAKNFRIIEFNGPGPFWHLKAAKHLSQFTDIFFSPTSYITPALLPKNFPVILAVHDLVAFLFPRRHNKKAVLLEKIFLKKSLKKATYIAAVSQSTKNDLIEKFRIEPKKIKIIPASISSQDFQKLPQDSPLGLKSISDFINKTNLPEKFFLAVGTLEPRKNHKNLIKAFAIFRKTHPDFHLLIVGQQGWQYQALATLISSNYLEKHVHLLGYLSTKSLVFLYNLAQALVFPSFYEGFGMPPLEAMNCGCPVITSNVSSLPEVCASAALYVNPHKPDEIAAAMRKIITDLEFRQNLIEIGLKQSKNFSWDLSAQKLLTLFKPIY